MTNRGVQSKAKVHWKLELKEILSKNNGQHSLKDKIVSNSTKAQREECLFQCFYELRQLGFKLECVRSFKERHFQALLKNWLEKGQSAATIQKKASILRTFSTWIDKQNMIKTLEHYVDAADVKKVKRVQVAQVDKSWSTNNVSFQEKIEEAILHDSQFAAQLMLVKAFGLRRKEAICLRLHEALNRHDHENHLMVERGTKGGRPRIIPIDSEEKKRALEYAKLASKNTSDGHLGWEGLTLEQSIKRYTNLMTKFELTKNRLGVTGHGLRHEYINDRYEELTGAATPVRGGKKGEVDPELDREVKSQLIREVGHGRISATASYFGSQKNAKPDTGEY